MSLRLYIYMCVYVHIHTCIHLCTYIYMYICTNGLQMTKIHFLIWDFRCLKLICSQRVTSRETHWPCWEFPQAKWTPLQDLSTTYELSQQQWGKEALVKAPPGFCTPAASQLTHISYEEMDKKKSFWIKNLESEQNRIT